MEKYTGKSIFKGIAIGKILFYQKGEQPVKRVKIEDTAEQIKRYEDARAKAAEQLQGLYEKALKEVGEANAAVFEVHQMMLEDDDYIDSVVNIIETQQVNAEFAVATTGDNFQKCLRRWKTIISKQELQIQVWLRMQEVSLCPSGQSHSVQGLLPQRSLVHHR